MAVAPDSPQEDEVALASMCELSFYHGLYFPKQFEKLVLRGLFFDGAGADQIDRWRARFKLLVAKLSLAHKVTNDRPLLLKNPVYTGRAAMLREMFPDARFIHIHRHPWEVFLSMRNFYIQLLDVMSLQNLPRDLDIDGLILSVYDRMMRAHEVDFAAAPDGSFVELSYNDLIADPIAALKQVYTVLGISGFVDDHEGFSAHLKSVHGYRPNQFTHDAAAARRVSDRLGYWIAKWGYDDPVGREIA